MVPLKTQELDDIEVQIEKSEANRNNDMTLSHDLSATNNESSADEKQPSDSAPLTAAARKTRDEEIRVRLVSLIAALLRNAR